MIPEFRSFRRIERRGAKAKQEPLGDLVERAHGEFVRIARHILQKRDESLDPLSARLAAQSPE